MKQSAVVIFFLAFSLFSTLNAQDIKIDTVSSFKNRDLIEPIYISQMDSGFIMTDSLPRVQKSTNITGKQQAKKSKSANSTFRPNPTRSVWLGLVFPGLGQIYNRSFWKLPIIYGGFAGCFYAIQWNNKYYKDYLSAYMDIMDADPNTQSYLKVLPYGTDPNSSYAKTYLNQKQNYYRKYRDLSIIITVGVYALSIVDAFVDAQLHDFDISSDVSMKIQPTFIENPSNPTLASTALGMRFKVNF